MVLVIIDEMEYKWLDIQNRLRSNIMYLFWCYIQAGLIFINGRINYIVSDGLGAYLFIDKNRKL